MYNNFRIIPGVFGTYQSKEENKERNDVVSWIITGGTFLTIGAVIYFAVASMESNTDPVQEPVLNKSCLEEQLVEE